jgi:hypothetical protein
MDELDRKVLRFIGRCIRGIAVAAFVLLFSPVIVPFVVGRWAWTRYCRHRDERRAHERRERDRENREQAERARAGGTRRRSDARARCELAYSLHAKDIADRFPRSMFDAFLQTYMSDTDEPEDVERRGRELEKMIDEHRKSVKPEKRPRTIQDLAEWYLREKQRIDALPLDEELKQEHMAALDMRYAELTQEMLQSLEP